MQVLQRNSLNNVHGIHYIAQGFGHFTPVRVSDQRMQVHIPGAEEHVKNCKNSWRKSTYLNGNFPNSFCPMNTILATQKNRMSFPVSKRLVG